MGGGVTGGASREGEAWESGEGDGAEHGAVALVCGDASHAASMCSRSVAAAHAASNA